jgi:hypothetical protein
MVISYLSLVVNSEGPAFGRAISGKYLSNPDYEFDVLQGGP